MSRDYFMELRGREVCVEVTSIVNDDPDVGIMRAYPDEFTVCDLETGAVLELTESEEEVVVAKVADRLAEGDDDWPDWP